MTESGNNSPLLKVDELYISYKSNHTLIKAVNGVTLTVRPGETVGLVGESGCGKTTLGKTLIGLLKPDRGSILVNGENWSLLKGKSFRHKRKTIQMVFQNPFGSLNPKMTVEAILHEPLEMAGLRNRRNRKEQIETLLKEVGIDPSHAGKYPHEFSGGQCQRIAIARALAARPSLIIADEPVSSLDVSVQAQILNLFDNLKQRQLSMLFISHDLSVVKYISDRIAVMYKGIIVEQATSEAIFSNPLHPYTRLLLDSIPQIGKKIDFTTNQDSLRTVNDFAQGCVFCPRCPDATQECFSRAPTQVTADQHTEHSVCCHKYQNLI